MEKGKVQSSVIQETGAIARRSQR